MADFYPDILDQNQKTVLPRLILLSKYGFYLAGGTALSLQVGHRTSVDFVFFTPKHFDSNALYLELEKEFGDEVKKIGEEYDTLFVKILDVDISFFWYKYELIDNPVSFEKITLSSIKDISAMKMVAITRRPVKRDYIDAYYLIKLLGIEKMLHLTSTKYPIISPNMILRALTYFDDLEKEAKRPITVLDPKFSWDEAKDFILEEVKKYQLSKFKK